eukprot:SAG31_NODE_41009_length_278_cov_0.581006_1_plen_64_part_01
MINMSVRQSQRSVRSTAEKQNNAGWQYSQTFPRLSCTALEEPEGQYPCRSSALARRSTRGQGIP